MALWIQHRRGTMCSGSNFLARHSVLIIWLHLLVVEYLGFVRVYLSRTINSASALTRSSQASELMATCTRLWVPIYRLWKRQANRYGREINTYPPCARRKAFATFRTWTIGIASERYYTRSTPLKTNPQLQHDHISRFSTLKRSRTLPNCDMQIALFRLVWKYHGLHHSLPRCSPNIGWKRKRLREICYGRSLSPRHRKSLRSTSKLWLMPLSRSLWMLSQQEVYRERELWQGLIRLSSYMMVSKAASVLWRIWPLFIMQMLLSREMYDPAPFPSRCLSAYQ